MFTSDRAAGVYASAHDLPAPSQPPLRRPRYTLVEQHAWVQVAIAGVKDVGDRKSMALADLSDLAQYLGKAGARHNPVENVVIRRQPAQRADRRFAASPEPLAARCVVSST